MSKMAQWVTGIPAPKTLLGLFQREKAPAPPPPTVMPTPDDETVRLAQRRSVQTQLSRRGRASTILSQSDASDTLGS